MDYYQNAKKNIEVLDDVKKQCEENLKDNSKRSYITARLRTPALELLITNRYIEENQEFFTLAETCLSDILTINDQLCIWETKAESTEKWLLGYAGYVKSALERLMTLTTSVYSKIVKVI